MQRTRTSALATDVSLLPPLLAAMVRVMRPASSDTSTNRSFLFGVWIVLLRIVSHSALAVAATSWVCEIAAVALAEGELCAAVARSGAFPVASTATAARAHEAIPMV